MLARVLLVGLAVVDVLDRLRVRRRVARWVAAELARVDADVQLAAQRWAEL